MIRPGKDLTWKQFFKRLIEEWSHDEISNVGASLTFYGLLAVFPFLIFLVALFSYFITPSQSQALIAQLAEVAPAEVTNVLADRIHALQSNPSSGLLTIGAIGAIWSASSGLTALMQGLNRAYDVKETRPWWKTRGIALGSTILLGGIALVAALIAIAVPAVASAIGGPIGSAIDWLRLPIAGFMMMVVWALIYRFVPNIKLPFKILTPGSVVGVIVWVAASYGFTQYVKHFGKYEVTYGAVGGIIVVMTWMWVSAQVILLGAEINKVLAPAEKREAAGSKLEESAKGVKPEDRAAGLSPPPKKQLPAPRPPRWQILGVSLGALWLARRWRKAS